MRVITPLLSAAIFVAALVISYMHTYELMSSAGLSGVLAHLGVVTFELAFALGTLSLIFDSASRVASLVSIALGLSVVAAANVMSGLSHGVPGVAIGVAIPAAVVVAEVLLKGSLRRAVASGDTASSTETRVSFERHTVTREDDTGDTVASANFSPVVTAHDTGPADVATVSPAHDTSPDSSDTAATAVTSITSVSERRAIVATRRSAGVALSDIAAELGVSVRTVQRDMSAVE